VSACFYCCDNSSHELLKTQKLRTSRHPMLASRFLHNFSGYILSCRKTVALFYSRGLRTFLSEGHISSYTTVRGPDIFRNVIVSGYVTFYQVKKFFREYINFSLLTKWLCGPDEMASRAVVWRPHFHSSKIFKHTLKKITIGQLYKVASRIPLFKVF